MTHSPLQRDNQAAPELVEHFFRHEYGRLVALLLRRWGPRRLELIEDVVQSALSKALATWSRRGIPENPGAWLFRTAHRLAIDAHRHRQIADRILPQLSNQIASQVEDVSPEPDFDQPIGDEPLRLLFLCCHPAIPEESRIALALKTVSGFSVKEIASGLLTTVDNVEKRLSRARERLRQESGLLDELNATTVTERLESVMTTVYLVFNEGYSASQGQTNLRRDLCIEALRLSSMLARHSICGSPGVWALHALLLFHSARLDSRLTEDGQVILLADQNRETWNGAYVHQALDWMLRSAQGNQLSRYHIEAGIAWEHCRANVFESTDWARIADYYARLADEWGTPMVRLNRAIAISYAESVALGIEHLLAMDANDRKRVRPWWDCALAQMYQRQGEDDLAIAHWRDALALAIGPAQRAVIEKQLQALLRASANPQLE